MEYIKNFIFSFNIEILLILSSLLLICLLWIFIITLRHAKLEKRYKKFMRNTSSNNLEGLLDEYAANVALVMEKLNNIQTNVDALKDQTDHSIQKCNVIRYNAFSDTGSDLSYSIALLDNFNNGVVLTGIYGRNETINYVKPINMGISKYQLSTEEQIVLDRCLKKNNK